MINFNAPQEVKDANRKLIEKYPWLMPWNRTTGRTAVEGFTETEEPEYDYEWTELDAMPNGWRKAFGDEMLESINNELLEHGDVNKFRILQIKEKYGYLHIYVENGTDKIYNEIIPYYELLSEMTCINCGEPATGITLGWVSPYCDKCASNLKYQTFKRFEDFENEEINEEAD